MVFVLLRERSDRKGPRAPEAEFGKRNSKRNSGSETLEAKLGEAKLEYQKYYISVYAYTYTWVQRHSQSGTRHTPN